MSNACLIIPCYNEAARLDITCFENFLRENNCHTICFGNDGSTDSTSHKLRQLQEKFPLNVFVISSPVNIGKAEIVRLAINQMYRHKDFKYYGYFDADLSTPLDAALSLIEFLEKNQAFQLIIGSRIQQPGIEIHKNYFRHIGGRIFSLIVNSYFDISYYDTQCGAKIMRGNIVPLVFDEPFVSRWLFDIEIILRLRKKMFDDNLTVKEVPLKYWANKKGSKITFSDILKLPLEIKKIKKMVYIPPLKKDM